MARIFVTSSPARLERWYDPGALARLRSLGEVRVHGLETVLDTEQLIEAAAGCEVIVSDRATPGSARLFASLGGLVAFVRCAMDVGNIDVEAASAHGVLVTRASASWVDAVAELTIGSIVALARKIPESVASYRQGIVPLLPPGRQLAGLTLGIVGYGAIGRRVAELGAALRMRVVVSDPHVDLVGEGVSRLDLISLLGASDVVVCAAAATSETFRLLDGNALAAMRPTAYLVNVSRGQLIDEDALEAALDGGRLAGAALDVGSDPDNLPALRLAHRHDVVATPHIGGMVPEAIVRQALETADQVAEILAGRTPQGALNGARADRLRRFDGAD
jgi:D-3-phosphoglycerate dehydrogenase / 2-oxoglutarate reductase